VEKIHVALKSDKINGYIRRSITYNYGIISSSSS